VSSDKLNIDQTAQAVWVLAPTFGKNDHHVNLVVRMELPCGSHQLVCIAKQNRQAFGKGVPAIALTTKGLVPGSGTEPTNTVRVAGPGWACLPSNRNIVVRRRGNQHRVHVKFLLVRQPASILAEGPLSMMWALDNACAF